MTRHFVQMIETYLIAHFWQKALSHKYANLNLVAISEIKPQVDCRVEPKDKVKYLMLVHREKVPMACLSAGERHKGDASEK